MFMIKEMYHFNNNDSSSFKFFKNDLTLVISKKVWNALSMKKVKQEQYLDLNKTKINGFINTSIVSKLWKIKNSNGLHIGKQEKIKN